MQRDKFYNRDIFVIKEVMKIEILNDAHITDELQGQVVALYKQLAPDLKATLLPNLLNPSNNITVVLCRLDDRAVGIAILATYTVLSGRRGIVEDVVVDKNQRGQGIGKLLIKKLLEEGKRKQLDGIMLFSGHHRKAAISLYKSLGFTQRDSGVYQITL